MTFSSFRVCQSTKDSSFNSPFKSGFIFFTQNIVMLSQLKTEV